MRNILLSTLVISSALVFVDAAMTKNQLKAIAYAKSLKAKKEKPPKPEKKPKKSKNPLPPPPPQNGAGGNNLQVPTQDQFLPITPDTEAAFNHFDSQNNQSPPPSFDDNQDQPPILAQSRSRQPTWEEVQWAVSQGLISWDDVDAIANGRWLAQTKMGSSKNNYYNQWSNSNGVLWDTFAQTKQPDWDQYWNNGPSWEDAPEWDGDFGWGFDLAQTNQPDWDQYWDQGPYWGDAPDWDLEFDWGYALAQANQPDWDQYWNNEPRWEDAPEWEGDFGWGFDLAQTNQPDWDQYWDEYYGLQWGDAPDWGSEFTWGPDGNDWA